MPSIGGTRKSSGASGERGPARAARWGSSNRESTQEADTRPYGIQERVKEADGASGTA